MRSFSSQNRQQYLNVAAHIITFLHHRYLKSFEDMLAFPLFEEVPASARDEYASKFTELAAACLQRHAPVVPTVAQGILELKRHLKRKKLDRCDVYCAFKC